MRQFGHALQSFWSRDHGLSQEAGGEMFGRLRRQLTFWYSAMLAGMLLLLGVVLYFGAQYLLFSPVQHDATLKAVDYAYHWDQSHPYTPCWDPNYQSQTDQSGGPTREPPKPPMISNGQVIVVACFDANGNLLQISDQDGATTPFVTNSLVSQALESSPATGTINDANNGDLYTYAVEVTDQSGNILGVVQVGESVSTQENVLNLLLILLLSLGAATLVGAAVGGLLLADRALAPARLAFARQQAFIADASHELRTPLTLMRADAEVLLAGREHLDPDDAALLEDIVTEAGHMGTLANNMLTLARLDAGQFHQEREVVDLATIATQAAHRVRAFAREKQVTVQAEEMGQALVIGDKSLLEQATMILLDNAIKYNRAGGSVTLRATVTQKQACLEVSDTGIGIATEHLPHLGERFYRVDKARSREVGGAGLGLSIARSIAVSHGGTLTLTSVAGQGATARMLLPAVDTDRH
jgi:signal transduction histidine kinase